MSRENALAVAGYFPMPAPLLAPVCTYLRRGSGRGRPYLLDPCAGEGHALAALAAHLGPDAVSRAVELHAGRAAEVAALLGEDAVLCADALTGIDVSSDAFGLLWLNPPYHRGQFELEFLLAHTPLLCAGGILCLIVPQPALHLLSASLAAWYSTITCYAFPAPEYRAYKQVVLFGERKGAPLTTPTLAERLRGLAAPDAPIPVLGTPGYCYGVPLTAGPVVFGVRSAARVPAAGGLWDDPEVGARLWPALTPSLFRPLMPLSRGHLAQFGVCGLLSHTVLVARDGTPYLVKGRALKGQQVRAWQEDGAAGQTVHVRVTRERAETGVTLLDLQSGTWRDVRPGAQEHSLGWFVDEFGASLTRAILATCPPVYTPALAAPYRPYVRHLARPPLGRQAAALAGAALSLERGHRCTILSAEMGCGKSYMALGALYAAWRRRREHDPQARLHALILCPSHLVPKWVREAQATIPGVQATSVDSITEIEAALGRAHRAAPVLLVLSKERAKLGYARRPAVWRRLVPQEKTHRLCCPQCGAVICYSERCGREGLEQRGVPISDPQVCVRYRLVCANPACRSPLWQPHTTLLHVPQGQLSGLQPRDRPVAPFTHGSMGRPSRPGEPRRVPLGSYIARRLRRALDVLVLDECHEFKGGGSAQGLIAGQLAAAIPQVLALTGTLFGGYASSLFYLLYRLDPATRAEFAHSDLARWIDTYGLYEITERETERDGEEIGYYTRRKTNRTTTRKEIPGLMPQLIARLARHTIFLRLADVAPDLPPYDEQVISVAMVPAQQDAYDQLKGALLAALRQALVRGSKRLLGAYVQSLLAYPDAPYRDEIVCDPKDEHVIAQAPALAADVLYPKEQALLDLIAHEVAQRRKVLVYVQHTGSRDITARLGHLLTERGVQSAVLHAAVAATTREAWVAARLAEGVQVLLTHPRCVQTGLDLLDFPTLVFYQCEYSAYVVAQASRRSWRIGQRHPVHVYHLVYGASAQENALRLVARKRRAAKQVDGDLDEDGLVAQAETDGFLTELAASLVDEEGHATGESADALLAQVHAEELADAELLGADMPDKAGVPDRAPVAHEDAADEPVPVPVMPPGPAPARAAPRVLSLSDFLDHPRPTRRRRTTARSVIPAGQLALFAPAAAPAAAASRLSGPPPLPADEAVVQLALWECKG